MIILYFISVTRWLSVSPLKRISIYKVLKNQIHTSENSIKARVKQADLQVYAYNFRSDKTRSAE